MELPALGPDQTVFKQGDRGDKFYIIKSGEVRAQVEIAGAGDRKLSLLNSNIASGIPGKTKDSDAASPSPSISSNSPTNRNRIFMTQASNVSTFSA